jgi:hypothetical protein
MPRQIPKPTPAKWRDLPYSKRLDVVVKQYLLSCTDLNLFPNGKMNPSYFAIRKFLDKRPLDEIAKIYDFLYSLTDKHYVNITGLYDEAERHRKKLLADEQKAKIAEMKVEQYKEISLDDILNL